MKFLSLIGCFVSAFCFFAGREIILLAFGNQWEPSILPFRIISLSIWMQMLTHTIAPIYQSIGNTKLMFKSVVIMTSLIILSIVTGVCIGSIVSVAICVALAYIVNYFISFLLIIKYGLNKSFVKFSKNFCYEALIMGVLVMYAFLWPFNIENNILSFVTKFVSCIGLYALLLVVTKQYKSLFDILKKGRK